MIDFLVMGKDLASHGQVLIYLIIFCSLTACVIAVDRLISFHRAGLNRRKFMDELLPVLRRENIIESISLCDRHPSALARIIKSGILKHDREPGKVREVMRRRAEIEVAQLEKYLSVLSTIAYTTPLLGLLGTVLGLIEVFVCIQQRAGVAGPGEFAGGMGAALFTTAAGLAVAIPTILVHNYLASRIDDIRKDSDDAISEIVEVFSSER